MTRPWRLIASASMLMAAASMLLSATLYVQGGQVGRKARDTQCDREPVTAKIAKAAYDVRSNLPAKTRITPAELRRFLRQAPKDCPQPTK